MAWGGPSGPKRSETFATGSPRTARTFLSTAPLDCTAFSGLRAHFLAPKWAFWPSRATSRPPGPPGNPNSDYSARLFLQIQATPGRTTVL